MEVKGVLFGKFKGKWERKERDGRRGEAGQTVSRDRCEESDGGRGAEELHELVGLADV